MKRKYLIYACIGFLFGFFTLTGQKLAMQGNLIWDKTYTVKTLLSSLLIGMLAGAVAVWGPGIFRRLSAVIPRIKHGDSRDVHTRGEDILQKDSVPQRDFMMQKNHAAQGRRILRKSLTPQQIFGLSFLLIFLCWLPVYLAYYPGICAYDVTVQTGQIVDHAYNDHHPIAHTLLLAGSMRLGESVFADVNTGLAVLTFVQMTCLAAVIAWGIALLAGRGIRRGFLILLQIYGMAYPFHFYMSVSVIKDVFFSVFFLIQMLALCEVIRRRKSAVDGYDVLFFLSGVGMQLFRTNGRYAMLVLAVFVLMALLFGRGARRFWGKLCINCVLSLLLGSLCLSGLFRLTGAQQGDRREMLSMPIQQLARCMLYHGGVGELAEDDGTMAAEDRKLINDFLLDESYREYRLEISDPVKSHTNTYVVRYRTGDFVRTYFRLLGQYPGDFINAALAVNAGYLYVGDESHADINKNGVDRGLGYVQTRWVDAELNPRGIYQDSKWEGLHEFLEKWADENAYLKIPVLKFLFVPGVFLWLYLLLAGRLAERRNYAGCVPLALVLGYYITLFLGPAVQLRYLYPLMLTLPFAALFLLCGSEEDKFERNFQTTY